MSGCFIGVGLRWHANEGCVVVSESCVGVQTSDRMELPIRSLPCISVHGKNRLRPLVG